MKKPVDISTRMEGLRELYRIYCTNPGRRPKLYSEDRRVSLGYLRGWRDHDGADTSLLRHSLAEAAELDDYRPLIDDRELIVGRIDDREYTPQEQAEFDELYRGMDMSPISPRCEYARARGDHIVLDYEKLLRVGINGLLDELRKKQEELRAYIPTDIYDTDILRQEEFCECCIIELEAVLRLAKRYADEAERQASLRDDARREELLGIAETLRRVPAEPASGFREAVQSAHFFTFNLFGLYPLGRPDRYLLPYYEQDLAAGRITPEEAQELIDNLCLLVSTYVFSRAASGFIVGGRAADGNLVENDLTWMFLTALDHIRMPDPNGALAVCDETGEELLQYAAQILGRGVTHPAFYNDAAIQASLVEYGISPADASDFIHTTCAEISVCGKSRMYTTSVDFNLPRILLRAAEDGEAESVDELIERCCAFIRTRVAESSRTYLRRILEAGRNGLQPMRVSALVDDCIARGKSVYEGGARYSYMQPILVGFANFCDSLMAIDTLVFKEKKLTLAEFNRIVEADFEDNEPLRQYILHKIPHYGNSDARVDELAARMGKEIGEIFRDRTLFGACISIPGTFSYVNHAGMGRGCGATYDGRRAQTSFSDGCCPVQGMDRSGPTAMIGSLTSWDQHRYLGGMVVNVKFAKSLFDDEKQRLLISLVRAFVERGGIEMQVNVVDRSVLEDALVHPEDHGDLLVRIGGFSDYFVKQKPWLQQEIMARQEY